MADDAGAMGELRRLLDERTAMLTRTGAKLRDSARARRELEAQRDAAAAELGRERAAREEAQKKYDESPHRAEAERLRGELRERDTRAAFDRVAEAKGLGKDARDMAYRLAGIRPDGDTPDEAAIGRALDALRDQPGGGRLFGDGAGAEAAVGSGRGGRDVTPGTMRVTTDQLKDGAWCMANARRMKEAKAKGLFEIVES